MFLIPLGTHSYVIPFLSLFESLGFLIVVYTFNQPLRHPTTRQHSRISSVNSERLAHLAIIKLYRQLPQQAHRLGVHILRRFLRDVCLPLLEVVLGIFPEINFL